MVIVRDCFISLNPIFKDNILFSTLVRDALSRADKVSICHVHFMLAFSGKKLKHTNDFMLYISKCILLPQQCRFIRSFLLGIKKVSVFAIIC
jgi:hypothetical protein